VTATATTATAGRVLAQLRRDPRTIALVLLAPVLLLWLLKLMVEQRPGTFDCLGAPLIGLFPFIQMFLITAITVLRERTSGTLERLMATPLAKLDLLAGYALAFALLAAAQALLTSAVAFLLLDLDVSGPPWAIIALALANALLGMALGLLASTLATTEFQATEFMPAFVLPQLLLCGLLVPRDQMAPTLETISRTLPLTYAFDALDRLANQGALGTTGTIDLVVVLTLIGTSLALGAATLRRRTT
jgi:ABC-2 type transport system permease protein